MNYQPPSNQNREAYVKFGPICYQEIRRKQWYLTQFSKIVRTILALKYFLVRPASETEALILRVQELKELRDQLITESGYPLWTYGTFMPEAG
jgi:hypothetical protein